MTDFKGQRIVTLRRTRERKCVINCLFAARVTRVVCEKVAQNVAQPIIYMKIDT
jgi:hypothetical protein